MVYSIFINWKLKVILFIFNFYHVQLQKQKDTLNELAENLFNLISSAREDWEGEQSAGIKICINCVSCKFSNNYISKWTRIFNLDSYLIFFLFLASRSSSVVNPDLNSLVSAVTFGRGMFDDTCAWLCFEAKWPTQLELISVFITWNDKEYRLFFWMGCKCIARLPLPAFHQASLTIYPLPIFIIYTYWDLHTENVQNSKNARELSVFPNTTKRWPCQVSHPDLLTWNPAH